MSEPFSEILERHVSRRDFLHGVAGAAALLLLPDTAHGFAALNPGDGQQVTVAAGHRAATLLRWGDPIHPDAPPFDPMRQSAAAQARQFGYNCDYIGFLPLGSDRGLLAVNHEFTLPELMFPAYDAKNPTREQVDIQLQAVGMSVVEIRRQGGSWQPRIDSRYNRRITMDTPFLLSGPVAGSSLVRTSADPGGRTVLGTTANCSGGRTPWGTVLSGEENVNYAFAHLDGLSDRDPRQAWHRRYGIFADDTPGLYDRFHPRFDVRREPNEPFRFGWVVEIDPYDPDWTPRKRTALGRFKHEAANFAVQQDGQVAVYSGDDERFEYVYRFVPSRRMVAGHRTANRELLRDGTLYVAKFRDDGTGEWLPLIHGRGGLTADRGFHDQAHVLALARHAADVLGATPMDRPEDIQVHPTNRRVYIALTNNSQRGRERRPAPDAANPRAQNRWGHVIELDEGSDLTSTSFTWRIFLLCGDPADPSTYFAGYPRRSVSAVACPDNLAFDGRGQMWIATDGAWDTIKQPDGLFAVPVEGPQRGRVRRFLSSVVGSEVAGPEFTPDGRTLFVSIQHPGQGSTFDNPSTRFPDGSGPPRPSVLAISREDGGPVG